jgi:hypothetical protein
MNPIQELADDIYRERVLRARRTPIEQKIFAGAELFEGVCERMAAGLRHENPGADEATIQELLRRRLDLLRRLESATGSASGSHHRNQPQGPTDHGTDPSVD